MEHVFLFAFAMAIAALNFVMAVNYISSFLEL